jgi:hypothetical protein
MICGKIQGAKGALAMTRAHKRSYSPGDDDFDEGRQ